MLEIYADVVFVVNFIMNLLVLALTSVVTKKRTTKLRLFLGALVSAAVFCVLLFMNLLDGIWYYPAGLVMLLSGLLVAFPKHTKADILRISVVSLAITLMLGGAGLFLFYFTNAGSIITRAFGMMLDGVSLLLLVLTAVSGYILFCLLRRCFAHALSGHRLLPLNVCLWGKAAYIVALMDTGHSLIEPLSRAPVLVVEYRAIKDILPEGLCGLFEMNKEDDLHALLDHIDGTDVKKRVRMIPYTTLGTKYGMLLGLVPDFVTPGDNALTLPRVVLGIYNGCLTNTGEYSALIGTVV